MKRNPYQAYGEKRHAAHQFRTLRETQIVPEGRAMRDGQSLINFASNDYLGLSQHPALVARARDYAARYGAGTTASRLVTGNSPIYSAIEERLARGKDSQAALVMNSGYQANLTVLAALADAEVVGRPVMVLADRLCHNSLLEGILLSGARLIRFRHNDYDHLEGLLREHTAKAHVIIVSESVFSMDGDCADLPALIDLAQRFEAMLYIDEAHATGVFGAGGRGLAAALEGRENVITLHTCGKALGCEGALVCAPAVVTDFLVNRGRGFIFSTAPSPLMAAAVRAALRIIEGADDRRARLAALIAHAERVLGPHGALCSGSQVMPVILGDDARTMRAAAAVQAAGFDVRGIRPPTVPAGTSRLRISLTLNATQDDVSALAAVLEGVLA